MVVLSPKSDSDSTNLGKDILILKNLFQISLYRGQKDKYKSVCLTRQLWLKTKFYLQLFSNKCYVMNGRKYKM